MMNLTINGEHQEVAATTVLSLLEEMGLNPLVTVVEQNGVIVARPAYREMVLRDGDILELVRIVGGG